MAVAPILTIPYRIKRFYPNPADMKFTGPFGYNVVKVLNVGRTAR